MATKHLHVVPNDETWGVKEEGSATFLSTHKKQEEAIQAGRNEAKRRGCELKIHAKDGTIRDSDSYGNDPSPPKDEKH